MKVTTFGFEVSSPYGNISIKSLLDSMVSKSGTSDTTGTSERRIYAAALGATGFYGGLVVTVKDQKSFCKLQEHVVEVQNLTKKERLMEFNFFILNTKNGVGLYQYYHNSCGMFVFGQHYLQRIFRVIKDEKITMETAAARAKGASKKKLEKIASSYRKRLVFSQLVQKEALEDILSQFKSIKAFEYDLTALENAQQHSAAPLSKFVRKRREKLFFQTGVQTDGVVEGIVRTIENLGPKRGRVQAVDFTGEIRSLQIANVPEHFGEEEFDQVAEKLNGLLISNFAQSKLIAQLAKTANSKEYKPIFHAETEE